MLVDVKVTAVRWCPLHRMSVAILKNDKRRLWLPLFVRTLDARRINALLSRRYHPPLEEQVDEVILNGVRGHPLLATVTTHRHKSARIGIKPYVEAIVLSLKSGCPLRVDDEIMLEMPDSSKAGSDRQVDLVLPEKGEAALRPSEDILKNEFQQAVKNEEYERAAVLQRIQAILHNKGV